jgi:hypothetical protein
LGDTYLSVWQISLKDDYRWSGIAYLAGVFAFFIGMSAYSLMSLRSWLTVGTRREHIDDDGDEQLAAASAPVVEVRIGAKTSSMVAAIADARRAEDANEIKFERMDLSFVDLRYTVTVTEQDDATGKPKTYDRALLQGINGYAKAGELTALMGSSGAGKVSLSQQKEKARRSNTVKTFAHFSSVRFLLLLCPDHSNGCDRWSQDERQDHWPDPDQRPPSDLPDVQPPHGLLRAGRRSHRHAHRA